MEEPIQIPQDIIVLRQFCQHLINRGIIPSQLDARIVADVFRERFGIPCPIDLKDAEDLLDKLCMKEVYIDPTLVHRKKVKGVNMMFDNFFKILVESNYPAPSRIKTLLHEIAEVILIITSEMEDISPLPDKAREQWANRFAAMVKMPPDTFLPDAEYWGLDLRRLAQEYFETLAGISRHIRDLMMQGRPYYFARFDIVSNPKVHCPSLIQLMEESKGLCVRMMDVVKTSQVNTRRNRGGALPDYNLPTVDHYRVIHPIFKRFVTDKRMLFIPSLNGAAAYEGGWADLFGDQDMAILISHYGTYKLKGFFILAIHPSDKKLIRSQLEAHNAEVREDIGWLFSWKSHYCLRQPKNVQPVLQDVRGGLFDPFIYRWNEQNFESKYK